MEVGLSSERLQRIDDVFWVDPEEDLIGIFMIQIRPNRDVTFRRQFKRLVYQAVIE